MLCYNVCLKLGVTYPAHSTACQLCHPAVPRSCRRAGGLKPSACVITKSQSQPAHAVGALPFVGQQFCQLSLMGVDLCAGEIPQEVTCLEQMFHKCSLSLMGANGV